MHPTLAKIVEHLQIKHADCADNLPAVIRECAEAGFIPGFIIAGIGEVYRIPYGEAKRLVVSHFFCENDKARAELDQFHATLESTMNDPHD